MTLPTHRLAALALTPRAPVVLFLPARDEEESVAAVVRRVPAEVAGHPVRCLVIDDGSTDRTAERARDAGAEVVSLGRGHGLGAAVRRGLAEGVWRGAAAVAFCDADGEYAPEELIRLVRPILDGRADYVVGSRFAGTIRRMLPHRRLGNRALTATLRFLTGVPISDGQSGYRALSRHAAAHAQVLTIDLLARGARYAEVPISYRFRESGRSFVRFGRYIAAVVPAIHRQLNTDVTPLRQAAWPDVAPLSDPVS
jgi:glycosyltransferase involved in cell wall biosynthesis